MPLHGRLLLLLLLLSWPTLKLRQRLPPLLLLLK
jgi:hypothetical protein